MKSFTILLVGIAVSVFAMLSIPAKPAEAALPTTVPVEFVLSCTTIYLDVPYSFTGEELMKMRDDLEKQICGGDDDSDASGINEWKDNVAPIEPAW